MYEKVEYIPGGKKETVMRNIFIVNATQAVTSESHPEGIFSTLPGYPKAFDSRNYSATEQNPSGDETAALNAARSAYYEQLSKLLVGSPSRVMWTLTLTRADGRQIMRESWGAMPDMTPQPEPQPQPEPEEAEITAADELHS